MDYETTGEENLREASSDASETPEVSFEDKLQILQDFKFEYLFDDKLSFGKTFSSLSIEFSLITILQAGWAVVEPKGVARVEALWDRLIEETIGDEYHGQLDTLDDIIYWSKDGVFPEEVVERVTQQGHLM